MNFLETIVGQRKIAVEEAKKTIGLAKLKDLVSGMKPGNGFKAGITREGKTPVRVIAEIKRASPSKGSISEDINPSDLARDYNNGGASAISVLTEGNFFKGSAEDLRLVRKAVPDMSLLRKDFIVDEYQIYESVQIGADAILLIVAALDRQTLKKFMSITRDCGLDALVEVHSEMELDAALSAGAEIVGVNNRNLTTFEVSSEVSKKLAAKIPAEIVSVSESGVADVTELKEIDALGYHAVLIGEHFMRAKERAAEVKKFVNSY